MGVIRPGDIYQGWSQKNMAQWIRYKGYRATGFRIPGIGDRYVSTAKVPTGVVVDVLRNYTADFPSPRIIVEKINDR